jgi:hypothetical protein
MHLASIAGDPSVDVYVCDFSHESYDSIFEGAPRKLLFSAGLSDIPQPSGEHSLYSEIALALPLQWRLDEVAVANPHWGWPLNLFKQLVRELQSRDDWGLVPYVIRLPEFPAPSSPGVEFAAVALLQTVPTTIIAPDHRRILACLVCPIYKEEFERVQVSGVNWLIDQEINQVLDPNRPNLARK